MDGLLGLWSGPALAGEHREPSASPSSELPLPGALSGLMLTPGGHLQNYSGTEVLGAELWGTSLADGWWGSRRPHFSLQRQAPHSVRVPVCYVPLHSDLRLSSASILASQSRYWEA